MARYLHLKWLAPVGGLAAAGVIALSAAPTGATIVCPKGVKPPSPYCSNVPPTAKTGNATRVKATTARLTGVAGPNVKGGDITQYFFQYGLTTAYGSQAPMPPGTIGSCPAGTTPPSPYCNVPKKQHVFADIFHLQPCTTYHFRLVATNPDGTATGRDRTFKTKFARSPKKVNAPRTVKAGHTFQIRFTLQDDARVKIVIRKSKGGAVASVQHATLSAGKHTKRMTAPRHRGAYVLGVSAHQSCGSHTVTRPLKVH